MKRFKPWTLWLVLALPTACGQQLVEFPALSPAKADAGTPEVPVADASATEVPVSDATPMDSANDEPGLERQSLEMPATYSQRNSP